MEYVYSGGATESYAGQSVLAASALSGTAAALPGVIHVPPPRPGDGLHGEWHVWPDLTAAAVILGVAVAIPCVRYTLERALYRPADRPVRWRPQQSTCVSRPP